MKSLTHFDQRFMDALMRAGRIRLPACQVAGKTQPAFYRDVITINENRMRLDGMNIEAFFIDPSNDIRPIIKRGVSKKITSLLIHRQFILDSCTDEQLEFIARDGAYTCNAGFIEVYTFANVGIYPQYVLEEKR